MRQQEKTMDDTRRREEIEYMFSLAGLQGVPLSAGIHAEIEAFVEGRRTESQVIERLKAMKGRR